MRIRKMLIYCVKLDHVLHSINYVRYYSVVWEFSPQSPASYLLCASFLVSYGVAIHAISAQ